MFKDPAKLQLIKDARGALKLPAEGSLTSLQKRDVSYWAYAVVHTETMFKDPAKLQLIKDARESLKLPAEGSLTSVHLG
jgi:hypothetical protein